MPLLVTIVRGGLAHVPIFLTRWPVAATITIISSQDFGRVDLSSWGGAPRPGIARAAIAIIPIAAIFLVVPVEFLGLGGLGAIKRHSLCPVKAERKGTLVSGMILGRF